MFCIIDFTVCIRHMIVTTWMASHAPLVPANNTSASDGNVVLGLQITLPFIISTN